MQEPRVGDLLLASLAEVLALLLGTTSSHGKMQMQLSNCCRGDLIGCRATVFDQSIFALFSVAIWCRRQNGLFCVAKLGFEHNIDLYTVYRPAVGIRKHQNIASGRLVWCLPSRGGDAPSTSTREP